MLCRPCVLRRAWRQGYGRTWRSLSEAVRVESVLRMQPPPSMSPKKADALFEGCLFLLLRPQVWVFVEFAVLSLLVLLIVTGRLGMHPVVGILAAVAAMVGFHVWLRARWAGVVLLAILTAFWSVVGAVAGWLFSPKSTKQLEWLHVHRFMSEEDFRKRLATALRESDPLWDAFFSIVGALVVGGLAYVIHQSVRRARSSEVAGPPETPFED